MDGQHGLLGPRDGYADAPVEKDGHPVVATIVGSVLLLLVAGVPAWPGAVPTDPDTAVAYRIGELVGGGLIAALFVWGIAYWITIRHAGRGWKIGSFAILFAVALVVTLIRIGGREGERMEDLAFVPRQIEAALRTGELPDQPVRAGSGPFSAMQATFLNRVFDERRAFERQTDVAGVDALLDFTITRDSPILDDCGRFDALAGAARDNAGRFDGHVAAASAAGDPFVARATLSEADRSAFLTGVTGSRERYGRQWRLAGEWGDGLGGLCRLLADRPWRSAGGNLQFDSQRDSDAANVRIGRINAIADELATLDRTVREEAGRDFDRLDQMTSGRR